VLDIKNALCANKHPSEVFDRMQVEISRVDTTFHYMLIGVPDVEHFSKSLGDFKSMKESQALVETVGVNCLKIQWFIALHRE